jgi:hypothetical protein
MGGQDAILTLSLQTIRLFLTRLSVVIGRVQCGVVGAARTWQARVRPMWEQTRVLSRALTGR